MNDSLDQSYGVSVVRRFFSSQLFPVYCLTLDDGRTTSNRHKRKRISLLEVYGVITKKNNAWKEGAEMVGASDECT